MVLCQKQASLAVQQDRLDIKVTLIQQVDIGIKISLCTAKKILSQTMYDRSLTSSPSRLFMRMRCALTKVWHAGQPDPPTI